MRWSPPRWPASPRSRRPSRRWSLPASSANRDSEGGPSEDQVRASDRGLELLVVARHLPDRDVQRAAAPDELAEPVRELLFVPSPRRQGQEPLARVAAIRQQGAPAAAVSSRQPMSPGRARSLALRMRSDLSPIVLPLRHRAYMHPESGVNAAERCEPGHT